MAGPGPVSIALKRFVENQGVGIILTAFAEVGEKSDELVREGFVEVEKRLKDIARKEKDLKSDYSKLEAEKAKFESEKKDLKSDFSKLEAEKANFEREKKDLEVKRKGVDEDRKVLKGEEKNLETGLAKLEVAKARLKSENDDLDEMLKRVDEDRQELGRKEEQLETDHANLEAEKSRLKRDYENLDKMRERLDEERRKVERKEAEIADKEAGIKFRELAIETAEARKQEEAVGVWIPVEKFTQLHQDELDANLILRFKKFAKCFERSGPVYVKVRVVPKQEISIGITSNQTEIVELASESGGNLNASIQSLNNKLLEAIRINHPSSRNSVSSLQP